MKKVFRLTAIAVIAMGLVTACGNKKNAEVEDTTVDTLMATEEVIDTLVEENIEEPVVEEPVKPATTKKTEKKEQKATDVPEIKTTKIGEDKNANNAPTKAGAQKVEDKIKTTDLNNGVSNQTPTKKSKKN